ncbi:MAG: cyclic nucleotide-binding domain-containing protein, partial [Chloroflexi bacterium]|nr:cyclic nucleotide-binding domain-containing protein [Chloroflexota bacterium]
MSSAKMQWITKAPLFGELTSAEQEAIGRLMRLEHVHKGETIFRRDDPSEALYLIAEGSVRLRDAQMAPIATLGAGSLLDEVGALLRQPRGTTAEAVSELALWVLSASDVGDLVAASPALGVKLSQALGSRLAALTDYLVETRLRPLSLFGGVGEAELRALAEQLIPLELDEGVCFCNATSPRSCFCVVEEGLLELTAEAGAEGCDRQELRAGDSFGEMALLSGRPLTQVVRSAGKTTVWALESEGFQQVVSQYPGLRQALSQDLRTPLSLRDRSTAVEMLRRVPLFAELPQEALRATAGRLLARHVPAGELVFAEGSAGDAFYMVQSGQVQILADSR